MWATGFDFGTGALNRMGIRGRDGLALEEYWADGPSTYLGVACRGFPNFFFPGGPHGSTGNNPRYAGDQVDFVMDVLVHMREHGDDVVEVDAAAEEYWSGMVNTYASTASFSEASYFFGANIPGKPIRYLLNPGGRPKLHSSDRPGDRPRVRLVHVRAGRRITSLALTGLGAKSIGRLNRPSVEQHRDRTSSAARACRHR